MYWYVMRDEDWARERQLDRDFEREPTGRRRFPPRLNPRGTARALYDLAGVLQPPVKIGGAA